MIRSGVGGWTETTVGEYTASYTASAYEMDTAQIGRAQKARTLKARSGDIESGKTWVDADGGEGRRTSEKGNRGLNAGH